MIISLSLPATTRFVNDPKDDLFRQCCLTKPLAKEAYAACQYTRPYGPMLDIIRGHLIGSPGGLVEYLECATGRKDLTGCCKKKEIEGELCLFFCNGSSIREALHPNMPSELVCAGVEEGKVEGMRKCFYENGYDL